MENKTNIEVLLQKLNKQKEEERGIIMQNYKNNNQKLALEEKYALLLEAYKALNDEYEKIVENYRSDKDKFGKKYEDISFRLTTKKEELLTIGRKLDEMTVAYTFDLNHLEEEYLSKEISLLRKESSSDIIKILAKRERKLTTVQRKLEKTRSIRLDELQKKREKQISFGGQQKANRKKRIEEEKTRKVLKPLWEKEKASKKVIGSIAEVQQYSAIVSLVPLLILVLVMFVIYYLNFSLWWTIVVSIPLGLFFFLLRKYGESSV